MHCPTFSPRGGLWSAVLVAMLAGCTSPPHAPPTAAVPAHFAHAPEGSTDSVIPVDWWQAFGDPVLDRLQAQLEIGNQNLQAAAARVAAAQAALGTQRAATLPVLNDTATATRSDSGQASLTRQPQNALSLGATASWELDLWGRLSSGVRAGEARLAASVGDLDAARLSARATLAQTYFTLRAAEARRAVLDGSVAAYRRTLALTQARLDAGVAPASDVLQARLQLRDAEVALLEAGTQQAQATHAIAVLLGTAPSALDAGLAERAALLPAVPGVPALLPAGVIQGRPDITAAERRLAAARWTTEIARTAWWPTVSIGASGGLRSTALDDLLRSPTLFWSLGPSLVQKLFDGGATRSAVDQARAGEDEALATYRQAVLAALQEVEDNLVLARRLADEEVLQQASVQDAQRTLDIVQAQYEAGTVGFLNVAAAQVNALGARQKLLDLQARRLTAVTVLLRNTAAAPQTLARG